MRPFARLLAAAIALSPGLGGAAHAEDYPERPVKVIVPYAAGGGTDAIARLWTEKLTQALGQPFVIENRGGASGTIGAEAAARAARDGYTLFVTGNATISLQPLFRRTTYDARRDYTPVARLGDLVTGYAVHPSTGFKSLDDLVRYARANPGKLAYGSAGQGTSTHMRLEILKLKTGIDVLHVPYRGSGDALNDLLAGTVQIMNEIVVLPHARAGKLTMLAISHPTRHPDFPDVPTLTELGIRDADMTIWMSMWAPAGTPDAITEKLNRKIVELVAAEDVRKRLRDISIEVPVQTRAELGRHLADELKKNAEIIEAARIRIE